MPPLNHLEADVDTQSHLLFEAAQIPMLIINPVTGEIIDANKAAIKYYGYSKSEFDNLKISDLNELSENEIFSEMELAAKQKRNHFFFIHRLSNGKLRDVEVHSGVIKSDNKRYLYSIIHDITDRRAAEAELVELNRDFITLLENTSDFISFKSRDNSFKFCSQALADITGHESWRDMRGKKNNDIFPSNIAKTYLEEERLIFKSGKPILNKIYPYQNIKGEAGWISTNKWPVFDEEKVAIGAFEISRDVTLEQENQKHLQVAANVFHKASEGLMVTDTEGSIIQVNEAFCILSGYLSKEIVGRTPSFLTSGHHDKTFFENMWKTLLLNKSWKGDIWNRQKDGGLFASRTSINAVTDSKGDVINYIGSFTDITLQLRHFEEIKHMAFHDALTGLPNRILLHDRLGQALKQADRQTEVHGCCMFSGFR
jgi:PAS domain S-box-containing protein